MCGLGVQTAQVFNITLEIDFTAGTICFGSTLISKKHDIYTYIIWLANYVVLPFLHQYIPCFGRDVVIQKFGISVAKLFSIIEVTMQTDNGYTFKICVNNNEVASYFNGPKWEDFAEWYLLSLALNFYSMYHNLIFSST